MHHDMDKLHVHIPNLYGEIASALKRSREIARLHSFNLYRLYAANTLSDFIWKAIALKGAKKSSMKGKAIAEAGWDKRQQHMGHPIVFEGLPTQSLGKIYKGGD